MTRVAVAYRDPQSATKLLLDDLVASRLQEPSPPAFLTAVEVATRLPERAPASPLLVVRSGPWDEWDQATAVNRVRLVSWGPDEDALWDVLSWAYGRLLAYGGGDDVVSFRYWEGPRRAIDPDFDVPIAAAVTRARMRPAIV